MAQPLNNRPDCSTKEPLGSNTISKKVRVRQAPMWVQTLFHGIPVPQSQFRGPGSAESQFHGIPVPQTPGSAESWFRRLLVPRIYRNRQGRPQLMRTRSPANPESAELGVRRTRRPPNRESAEPGVCRTGSPPNQDSAEPGVHRCRCHESSHGLLL